jgi:hypothetical protein
MATSARASAKTNAMIIAVNILGALDGFLPKALMLAKLPAANTLQGPKTQRPKIMTNAMLRLIPLEILIYPVKIQFLTGLIYFAILLRRL